METSPSLDTSSPHSATSSLPVNVRRVPRFKKRFVPLKCTANKSRSYPGVYVQQIASSPRTIPAIDTTITAFVGRSLSGPVNRPLSIQNFGEFEKTFGGLWLESQLGHAVRNFYLNGGKKAIIVRLANGGVAARLSLPTGSPSPNEFLGLQAQNPGTWGRKLQVTIDHATNDPSNVVKFNLLVEDTASGRAEKQLNLSIEASDSRFVGTILEQRSQLVGVSRDSSGNFITPNVRPSAGTTIADINSGYDGSPLIATDFTGPGRQANEEGLYALEKVDLFNLLVIPPYNASEDVDTSVTSEAAVYCERRRAFMIMDPPSNWVNVSAATNGILNLGTNSKNTAVYFPRIRQQDPLQNNQLRSFPPSGAMAGIFARTDSNRGVWKAPAGVEATIRSVQGFEASLSNQDNAQLNPLAINCLRTQAPMGPACWGSRTLQGHPSYSSAWKYIPVRRTALFIEESLYRGTRWAVFEPNNASLWGQIKQSVENFMFNLFRKGAFQGSTSKEAFFVKCGLNETMTTNDIANYRLIVELGFAPLKPAEFVILSIKQKTG